MAKTLNDLYIKLAGRINYPLKTTYRIEQKFLAYLNLIITKSNITSATHLVYLAGEPYKKTIPPNLENISIVHCDRKGNPIGINPDGTLNTNETIAIHYNKCLFKTGVNISTSSMFATDMSNYLIYDNYEEPILTSLFQLYNGIPPEEAVESINEYCNNNQAPATYIQETNFKKLRRKL